MLAKPIDDERAAELKGWHRIIAADNLTGVLPSKTPA
jgi:hypothetical protein